MKTISKKSKRKILKQANSFDKNLIKAIEASLKLPYEILDPTQFHVDEMGNGLYYGDRLVLAILNGIIYVDGKEFGKAI